MEFPSLIPFTNIYAQGSQNSICDNSEDVEWADSTRPRETQSGRLGVLKDLRIGSVLHGITYPFLLYDRVEMIMFVSRWLYLACGDRSNRDTALLPFHRPSTRKRAYALPLLSRSLDVPGRWAYHCK
jgi:hypothetical protein